MEDEELKNTIKELQEIINLIGDINMICGSREKTLYQKKINKAYNKLFELKKHLEFIDMMKRRKKWDLI